MFASETPTMFTMDNNTAIAALAPTATYEPTPSVEQVVPVATTTPRHWTFPIAAQPILRMEADGRLAPRVMGYEYLLRPTGGDPMEVAKRLDRIGLGVSLTRAMMSTEGSSSNRLRMAVLIGIWSASLGRSWLRRLGLITSSSAKTPMTRHLRRLTQISSSRGGSPSNRSVAVLWPRTQTSALALTSAWVK